MPSESTSIDIRPVTEDELVTWFSSFQAAFYFWPSDPQAMAEQRREHMELARTIGAFDGREIVGTYRSFSTRLTLPGGARVPADAVSAVAVRPTHRRRGLLTRMITRDLRESVDRGDVVSILIAAEWPIYGRFGFGPATWQATWTLRNRATTFVTPPTGTIDVVDALTARQLIPPIYDAYAAAQPGAIERSEHRWDGDLGITETPGRPRFRGQFVVHRDAGGAPDGYARFHGEERWQDMLPDHQMLVDELHAASPAAEIDLWRHLAQMDITSSIKAEVRREHEPMPWALADPRNAQVSGRADFLWVRILDVEKALASRTYDVDGELTLEIADRLDDGEGPAAGRYRLAVNGGAATCERTTDDPDLTLDVAALGAAVLGGTRLVDATRAGGLTEHRARALAEADRLFLTADPPWCSTWF